MAGVLVEALGQISIVTAQPGEFLAVMLGVAVIDETGGAVVGVGDAPGVLDGAPVLRGAPAAARV